MSDTHPKIFSLDPQPLPHTEALGWQWAIGCFETFLWREGRTIALDRHLHRLFRGCEDLQLQSPLAETEIAEALCSTLDPLSTKTYRVRLEAVLDDPRFMTGSEPPFRTRIGLRAVEWDPVPHQHPFSLSILDSEESRRLPPLPGYKPLDYSRRLRIHNRVLRAGFDGAAIVTEDLRVVSALTSNLFVRKADGDWVTPNLDSGCLPGVTRELILEGDAPAKIHEAEVHLHDLTEATAAFLVNSVRGVRPVARLKSPNGETKALDPGPAETVRDWYEQTYCR